MILSGPLRLQEPLLDAQERILLHLSMLRDDPDDIYNLSPERSYDGLGSCVNLAPSQVHRQVGSLLEKELVELRLGRPRGHTRQCKVAVLTREGKNAARGLRDDLGSFSIRVGVDVPGGEEGTVQFFSLREHLKEAEMADCPPEAYLASFIDKDRRLALDALKRSLAPGRVDITYSAPRVDRFFGREREMDEYRRILGRAGLRALVVHGMPGVGKTTLGVKLVESMKETYHTLWLNIRDHTTVSKVVGSLSDLISGLSGPELSLPGVPSSHCRVLSHPTRTSPSSPTGSWRAHGMRRPFWSSTTYTRPMAVSRGCYRTLSRSHARKAETFA